MSNASFDRVLMYLTNLHESFTKNARDVFIASENGTLLRLSLKMEQNKHYMTTRRLNQISKKQL